MFPSLSHIIIVSSVARPRPGAGRGVGRKGRQEQLSIVSEGQARDMAAGSPGDVNLSTLTADDGNGKKNISPDELKQLEERGRN